MSNDEGESQGSCTGDSAIDYVLEVRRAVSRFGATVAPLLAARVGQDEANLTSAVETLLRDVATLLGLDLLAHREVAHQSLGVRPDLAIDIAGARAGIVELKAPRKGVPGMPGWGDTKDRKQWEQLKALPNVLYSSGSAWAVYHYGKLAGEIATLEGDLVKAGSRLRPANTTFAVLLQDFLCWQPQQPRDLRDMIKVAAGLCHLLRDEVRAAIRTERNGSIKMLFTAHLSDWQEWLFPDLSDEEFADSYAQTITFGLLLARREGAGRRFSNLFQEIVRECQKKFLTIM